MHVRLVVVLGLTTVAAIGPAQATASAAAPTATASATVSACAGKGGALRVATRCRRGERRFRLVAEPAPRGRKGASGATGGAGPAGPKGEAGAAGTAGVQGAPGPQGLQGPLGPAAFSAGGGLDLAGTVFSLEVPLVLVRNSGSVPSIIDVTNTKHEPAFGSVRPAALEGTATSTADGNTAADAVTGVLGVVEPTNPGGFSAGVRGVNNGVGGTGIGVVGIHRQSGWGVYGQSPTGYGVVAEIDNAGGGGAALRAAFAGGTVGTALELSNGGIRVSGTNRPVFRADLSTSCGGNNAYAVVDNALINGDPDAMLVITHTDSSTGGVQFTGLPLGIVYNTAANPIAGCTTDRWLVFTETNSTMPDIIVNVLAVTT